MPPGGGRFGPQALSGPFSHLQQSQLQHHPNQHQGPGSAGFPPPSFNAGSGFPHTNSNSGLNPFASGNNANGLPGVFGTNGLGGAGSTGLASREAVLGFARGDQMLQQQQQREALRRNSMKPPQNKSRIRDVWQGNLAEEMQNLRELVEAFPYISMVKTDPLLI